MAMEECAAGHPAGGHHPGHTKLKPSVGASVLAACNPGPCTRRSTAERLCLSCNEFAAICALLGVSVLRSRNGRRAPSPRRVSRAAPTPTPRRGTPRGKMESVEPRRQRRVCPRDKKAPGDRHIDVRRCARVIADIDGHSITVSDRSLQGNRQTGSL